MNRRPSREPAPGQLAVFGAEDPVLGHVRKERPRYTVVELARFEHATSAALAIRPDWLVRKGDRSTVAHLRTPLV